MRILYCRRRLLLWLVLGLAGLVLALLVAGFSFRLAALTGAEDGRRLPVYQVETQQRQVAISFDASWGAEHTGAILDILDEYQVKATFFLVNIWLEDYPDWAAEIANRGHEIGLHSATHPHFTQLTQDEMIRELQSNFALIRETIGVEPTLFRCPFGDYNSQVVATAESCGYTCVQWSVDSWDWMDLTASEISGRVLDGLQPGDIILFHNNGLHTAEALPSILKFMTEQDLTPVPVGQLLLPPPFYVDSNGIQHSQ